ncbi:Hypothetical protein FORC18_4003 [Vibrio parahaemolyticus]|nr:hypothetical protein FORC8_3997 [Vibrio parahaemolyticus]APE86616.1 Hypothetical protein FORC18_4003 [Vibrio parahaemolyticus]ODZ41999.1 hypothetical protein BBN02_00380 [Vibrio parahaemolyticus]TOI57239.1 hypothetical protein CGI59_03290 [Vibrio parahaemolyticus]
MQTYNHDLAPLYRYMRATIVHVLGGEPKSYHSDEALDQLIGVHGRTVLNLLHDLIAMLDYLHGLIQINNQVSLHSEKDETLEVARKLVVEIHLLSSF